MTHFQETTCFCRPTQCSVEDLPSTQFQSVIEMASLKITKIGKQTCCTKILHLPRPAIETTGVDVLSTNSQRQ